MLLYKFVRTVGTAVAVTKDKDGSNLPKRRTPWLAFGTVDVLATDPPRIGANGSEIIAAIERAGFMILGERNA